MVGRVDPDHAEHFLDRREPLPHFVECILEREPHAAHRRGPLHLRLGRAVTEVAGPLHARVEMFR
jgi:hypothetical protein